MAWGILLLAGLLEVGWAAGLKYTEGFSRLWPTLGTAVALITSMALLGIALRTLPLGTAYAGVDRDRDSRDGDPRNRPLSRVRHRGSISGHCLHRSRDPRVEARILGVDRTRELPLGTGLTIELHHRQWARLLAR